MVSIFTLNELIDYATGHNPGSAVFGGDTTETPTCDLGLLDIVLLLLYVSGKSTISSKTRS